ncbi:MAG: efflux RND transporter permease subunit [Spirochaetales bacterium]|nr:efflux RND transporter permease subunit [Spirochaetales bacterium]
MKRFLEFCCRRKISTIALFISISICSFYSLRIAKIDFLPKMELPYFLIQTRVEGLNADDVEMLVTIPLEKGLQSLSNLKEISSKSSFANSEIFIKLHWNTEPQKALLEILNLTDTIFAQLPQNSKRPEVIQINPSERAVYSLAIIPKEFDIYQTSEFVKETILPELSRIEGSGVIRVAGLKEKDIFIHYDQDSPIPIEEVVKVINQNNFILPAGKITENSVEKMITIESKIENSAQIENLRYFNQLNQIRLGDFLEVVEQEAEVDDFFLYKNKKAIGIFIYKCDGANPAQTAKGVKQYIQTIAQKYPDLFEIKLLDDRSQIIKSSIKTLTLAGLTGAICIVLIVFIFYRSIWTTLIIIVPIPLSIALTICILTILGKSINIISISGMLTSLGMLVDNTMIVSENILRIDLRKNPHKIPEQLFRPSFSTLSSTITTIIVFLPAAILPGIAGILFKDLVIAITISLSISWLVSITLIPALFATFTPKMRSRELQGYQRYSRLIHYFEKRFILVPAIIVVTVLILIPLSILVRKEIAQELKQERIECIIDYKQQITPNLQQIFYQQVMRKIEAEVKIENFFTLSDARIGNLSISSYIKDEKQLFSLLTDGKKSTLKKINKIVEELNMSNQQAVINILPFSTILTETLGIKQGIDEYIVTGSNAFELTRNQERFRAALNEDGELRRLEDFQYIKLIPDFAMLQLAEISVNDLAQTIKTTVNETKIGQIYNDTDEKEIFIKNCMGYQNIESLKLKIKGKEFKVNQLCRFENLTEKSTNFRYNSKPAKLILTRGKRAKLSGVTNFIDIKKANLEDFISEFVLLIILAIIILFLCLCTQFQSIKKALIISINIPFSITGGIIFLLVTNNSLNIFSLIGLLVLTGSSINSSILLIDEYSALRGRVCLEKIIETSFMRAKAVLLSYLTTVAALIPSILMIPEKTDQSASAAVLVGGLSACLFSTLVITPTIYFVLEKRRDNVPE